MKNSRSMPMTGPGTGKASQWASTSPVNWQSINKVRAASMGKIPEL
jgi:hypothetical protein